MDLLRIGVILEKLRAANECEAAAEMDVEDAKHALDFAERKLTAMREVCQEVCDELGEAVNAETMAPLLLTQICCNDD